MRTQKLTLTLILSLLLSACNLTPDFLLGAERTTESESSMNEMSQSHEMVTRNSAPIQTAPAMDTSIRDYSRYSSRGHNKTLNDYARQIIMQLNTRRVMNKPIVVASFVDFDNTLNKTNSLGNQLSEAVLIELGQMGYPSADINLSNTINIEDNGNFVFSRKLDSSESNYCCVLSGNLIYESRGVRVNAKLINLKNKSLLGASSVTLPYFIVEHLGSPQSKYSQTSESTD